MLTTTVAQTWITRWDRQQEGYLPDREERFTGSMHVLIFAAFMTVQARTIMLFIMAYSTSAADVLTNFADPFWADASVLASSREGWANVLLESMACGTPVVASDIWGNPEVVRAPAAGVIPAACDGSSPRGPSSP